MLFQLTIIIISNSRPSLPALIRYFQVLTQAIRSEPYFLGPTKLPTLLFF